MLRKSLLCLLALAAVVVGYAAESSYAMGGDAFATGSMFDNGVLPQVSMRSGISGSRGATSQFSMPAIGATTTASTGVSIFSIAERGQQSAQGIGSVGAAGALSSSSARTAFGTEPVVSAPFADVKSMKMPVLPDDPGNITPPLTPVGDALWLMLLLAAVYAVYKTKKAAL